MAKKTKVGTNVEEVKRQNQQSQSGSNQQQGQFSSEFASETNAQEVRKQNQKSKQNKM